MEDQHKVLAINKLNDSTFILRFERKGIKFKTGQHLGVGPADGLRTREYSVYSAENDDYIEILVKEVIDGAISPQLAKLKVGDYVEVDDPVGSFQFNYDLPGNKRHVFIATGTGLAPFNSFVKTLNLSNYLVIHGVKDSTEAYGKGVFEEDKYIVCCSQSDSGDYRGRVTNYIKQNSLEKDTTYYLCGNSNMIHEMISILEEQGVERSSILTEVYF